MISENIFHVEVADGIYLISSALRGPNEDGRSLVPGNSTQNSYLIKGKERSILFDLAVNESGMYEYAERLVKTEVIVILSHGHFDHIFGLELLKEVWLHREDEALLRYGTPVFQTAPVTPCPKLHYLKRGEVLDLGDRLVHVIHMPGHTPGSIMLLDENTQLLLSGDAIGRTILFGLEEKPDFEKMCEDLEKLKQKSFCGIYSAHDRCMLPKEHIDLMQDVYRERIKRKISKYEMPGVGMFEKWEVGKPTELSYFCVLVYCEKYW